MMREILTDILNELDKIRERVDKLFEEFPIRKETESICSNIIETEDSIKIICEIPGVKKEDIKISLHDDILEIKAKREEEKLKEGARYILKEIKYGEFSRRIKLPTKVDIKNAKASYKDGILEIILPKAEEVRGYEIKIE